MSGDKVVLCSVSSLNLKGEHYNTYYFYGDGTYYTSQMAFNYTSHGLWKIVNRKLYYTFDEFVPDWFPWVDSVDSTYDNDLVEQ